MNPQNIVEIIFMLANSSGILIIVLYVYGKLLGINAIPDLKKLWLLLIFPLTLVPIYLFVPPVTIVQELTPLIPLFLFISITARVKFGHMLSSIIISYSITLAIYMFANFILAATLISINFIHSVITTIGKNISAFQQMRQGLFLSTSPYDNPQILIPVIFYMTIQLALTLIFIRLLFNTKRLKKGMHFLENIGNLTIGLILSIMMLITRFSAIFFTSETLGEGVLAFLQLTPLLIFSLTNFFSGLSIVCVFLMWRNQATIKYQNRMREKIISEQMGEMQELYKNNELLAKLVHRDNKLILAMYKAVEVFIKGAEKSDGELILQELYDIIEERKEIIKLLQPKI